MAKLLVFMDLESFNEEPITNGAHKYAETASIMLWGYAIGDAPAKVWDCTKDPTMPADLAEALQMCRDGRAMSVWHNGMNFDSVVLEHCGYGIPVESVIDTMVVAYQHGLPGALGDLCDIFGLTKDVAKDKDGRRLVQLFCKPRPANCKLRRATRSTHPEDWARFVNYCRLDVEAERELYRRLPKVNCTAHERAIQMLDAKINRRGMLMDVELAKAAIRISEEVKVDLSRRTKEQTGGKVQAATQRDAMLDFMRTEYGVDLPTLSKSEVEKRIQDESIPEPVRELLALRLLTAKNSVQKFKAIVNAVGPDGRLRGCLQFRGAARTGRFSGRLFQPQNLPRPSLSNEEIDCAIQLAKDGFITDFYDDPMHVLSNCLRGEIIAPEGKKLVVADYSNVEGRVLAWLAGEEWKIQAFKDFDAGHGHDLYKLTYGRTFNVDPEKVTKKQRQMGKVLELALGYGGGAGAFVTFARGYGIDLHDMAKSVREEIDPLIWRQAVESYEFFLKQNMTLGLDKEVFLACEAVKRAWRRANPHIASFWRALGDAVGRCLANPSEVQQVRNLKVGRTTTNLLIRLPSGRCLCYPMPRSEDCGRDSFSYLGVNQRTRKWERIESHGAKACLAEGTLVLTARGWKPIEGVPADELVWDGEEWVSQEGNTFKGIRKVVQSYGVFMTPDHKVLTTEGWKDASENAGFKRQEVGLPDGTELPRLRWEAVLVECSLHSLRKDSCAEFQSDSTVRERQERSFLRVPSVPVDCRAGKYARKVEDSSMGGLAFDEGALRNSDCPGMEELRRSRHFGMPRMEQLIRGVREGYGPVVPHRPDVGQDRCERELLSSELPLGYAKATGEQHEKDAFYRREALERVGGEDRDRTNHAPIPTGSRLSERAPLRQAGYRAKVFDLVNCGPRHRFVVLGSDGPVIVHNCENVTQAVSCDLLCDALLRLEANGFETVLTVHDEAITEAPDTPEYSLERMASLMTELPDWAKGLPLAAAGFEAYRYRKD